MVRLQAIEEYQREVAQSQRVAVTDICWFLQTTFPLNGNFLSYSSGAHSPECALSASFAYATSIFESMLLVFPSLLLPSSVFSA